MCDGLYKSLDNVFSACWSREDTAVQPADAGSVRRVRHEAICSLNTLQHKLSKHMRLSGIKAMEELE